MPRLAHRTNDFLTFRVMELFKQAQALQAAGKRHYQPGHRRTGLYRAARRGSAGARGAFRPERLQPDRRPRPLREAIAGFYLDQFGARVDPRRVIVTAEPPAP